MVLIFFPGLVIITYTNFQKTPAQNVPATTRCSQPLVAISNHSLQIATSGVVSNNELLLIAMSGCEQRVVAYTARGRFFLKVGICIDDETTELIVRQTLYGRIC